MNARHIIALARKESLHLARDPQALGLAIGMPLSFVLLFGMAISFDVEKVDIAACDLDRTRESRAFLTALSTSGLFSIVAYGDAPVELKELLERGEAKLGVVIEPGFERRLLRGDHRPVQIMVDGADTTTAQVAIGGIIAIAQHAALAGLALPLEARTRLLFNPEMRSTWFVVPGVVAVVLAIMAVLLSALTVAREWERGSMEQLFATPVDRLSVMLGKLLPYIALGQLQLLIVITAGRWIFDVPLRGSIFELMFAATLFLACALGQGLFISAVTKSQQLATQIGAVSAMLPSLLLSGFIFPIQSMPLFFRMATALLPPRWFMLIIRGLYLKGASLAELWPAFTTLAAMAIALTALAVKRFKTDLEP